MSRDDVDVGALVRKLRTPGGRGGIRLSNAEGEQLLRLIEIGARAIDTRNRAIGAAQALDPVELAVDLLGGTPPRVGANGPVV